MTSSSRRVFFFFFFYSLIAPTAESAPPAVHETNIQPKAQIQNVFWIDPHIVPFIKVTDIRKNL